MTLILASNSPRRKQLLAMGRWAFSVLPVEIDETPALDELPREYVLRLAESKALAAGRQIWQRNGADATIVAADTTVADLEGQGSEAVILGKPADAHEAENMLRRLRGRTHQVYTALAVYQITANRLLSDVCATDVVMRNYSDAEMYAYIASGDPLDKAGAYAIQHTAFKPVEKIRGCYTNVVGLPLCYLTRMLAAMGIPPEIQLPFQCLHVPQSECSITPEWVETGRI